MAESQVAVRLREIQGRYEDVDLGSYPFYRDDGYGTNLVMRGTDEGELERMKGEIREMIVEFGGEPIED